MVLFNVTISKSVKNKIGWPVSNNFQIVASENSANMQMLELVKSFFGNIGNISKHKSDNTLRYTVGGVSNCKIIQTHFSNYPLLTYKLVYYHLWSIVLDIMEKGEHLSPEGLLKIVSIKAKFKKGLSKLLLTSFPSCTTTVLPNFYPNLPSMNQKVQINNRKNINHSFSLPLILGMLDIDPTQLNTNLSNYAYGVFLLSLVALLCFINVLFYITIHYLIQVRNYELKYPKLNKIINLYKKVNILYIFIEALICFVCLILIVFFSLICIYTFN